MSEPWDNLVYLERVRIMKLEGSLTVACSRLCLFNSDCLSSHLFLAHSSQNGPPFITQLLTCFQFERHLKFKEIPREKFLTIC